MLNIFIVDDHPLTTEGLMKLIGDVIPGHHCKCFYRGEDALQAAGVTTSLDLLITELSLPDIQGNDLIKKIRLLHPRSKVLIISMYDQSWRLQELFKLNINGIVFKSCPVTEHTRAITEITGGNDYYSPLAREKIIALSQNDNHIKLTNREKDVLKLLHDGLKTKEIATFLGVSENTIETYRRSLLKKLGAQNTAGMISRAINLGVIRNG